MPTTNNKTSFISFLWPHIKPYKWWYLLMIQAPIIGAFYPFIYNYAVKLFINKEQISEEEAHKSLYKKLWQLQTI